MAPDAPATDSQSPPLNFDSPLGALATYSVVAAFGTVWIGYGVREFLRAVGGNYYCCGAVGPAVLGVLFASFGWAILLLGISRAYPVLRG